MAKKVSFDNLPAAVEKILALLASGESGHTALPELVQRIALLEKKIDHLERSLSPNRPVVDMQTVCKVLKLRPKAVSERWCADPHDLAHEKRAERAQHDSE